MRLSIDAFRLLFQCCIFNAENIKNKYRRQLNRPFVQQNSISVKNIKKSANQQRNHNDKNSSEVADICHLFCLCGAFSSLTGRACGVNPVILNSLTGWSFPCWCQGAIFVLLVRFQEVIPAPEIHFKNRTADLKTGISCNFWHLFLRYMVLQSFSPKIQYKIVLIAMNNILTLSTSYWWK